MSIEKLTDEKLASVAGGTSKEIQAAYACIRGDYGNGADRVAALRKAGIDPDVIQGMVNAILAGNDPKTAGYEQVARDVINGKYGNGADRVAALRKAGYDPDVIQKLVNKMMLG
ncbi:MAG: hypothetical protein IJQ43_08795 [Oscillospiraceae bacterium]|nr:hypothetical protein [Oscillospiraceae bacterium]